MWKKTAVWRRAMSGRRTGWKASVIAIAIACLPTPMALAEVVLDGAARPLTLASAVQKTLADNPGLRLFPVRNAGLSGEAETQRQKPALALNADLENVAGTGDYSGVDRAELTLALASVIELGGKREARTGVAQARLDQLESERQVTALDLAGEATRRYVDVVAAQEQLALARDAGLLAEEALASVQQRANAGAAPEAEVLRAQAALSQMRLSVSTLQNDLHAKKVLLVSLWGDTQPGFDRVSGNLFDLGEAGDFESLYQRALNNPAIHHFAAETRLREVELRLAQAQTALDIQWSGGVRQLQDGDDTALVLGVSVPLFVGKRNAGAIRSAQAARDEVAVRREDAALKLRSQLFAAFENRRQALATVQVLQGEVIPLLTRAQAETRAAYERGRYSYLEWAGARNELVAARRVLIEAAAAALRYRTEIEQLTAEPLFAASTSATGA